jgi:nitrogen-specific signal transduction histidine kinase
MLHLFDLKFQEKNLKLIIEYDSRIPKVLIEFSSFKSNHLNIISNAGLLQGKITVAVKLKIQTKKSNYRVYYIRTRIGIAKMIPTIFESFQQATSACSQ